MSSAEQEVCKAYTFPVSAHFVLQLGYFKATQRFFVYEQDDVLEDLQHIVDLHFQGRDPALLRMPSKPTRLLQQQAILHLTGYRTFDNAARKELESNAQRIVRLF